MAPDRTRIYSDFEYDELVCIIDPKNVISYIRNGGVT